MHDDRSHHCADCCRTAWPHRRAVLGGLAAASAAGAGGFVPAAAPAAAQASAAPNRPAVRTYASEPALVDSVNTHWIEIERGVVVVDAQRVLPEAERALRHIRAAAAGKPILGIFVTHPHTDHYGGLGVLKAAAPDAPIFAAAETIRSMAEDTKGFNAARRRRHGEIFPTQEAISANLPNRTLRDGDVVELGGLRIEIAEKRENEAEVTTLLHLPAQRLLFVGDLVNDGFVPVPFESLDRWLTQLDEIERGFPDARTVYMGHGVPGPTAPRIAAQRAYLVAIRDLVREAVARDGELSAAAAESITFELEARFPHWHGVGGNTRQEVLRQVEVAVARQHGARVADALVNTR